MVMALGHSHCPDRCELPQAVHLETKQRFAVKTIERKGLSHEEAEQLDKQVHALKRVSTKLVQRIKHGTDSMVYYSCITRM